MMVGLLRDSEREEIFLAGLHRLANDLRVENFHTVRRLPVTEDDLWGQVVLALLKQRDRDEEGEDEQNALRLAEELAFHHRFCKAPLTRRFVENTATRIVRQQAFDTSTPRKTAQAWLFKLREWELLLYRGHGRTAIYEFGIRLLDEYFAARHLEARYAERDP